MNIMLLQLFFVIIFISTFASSSLFRGGSESFLGVRRAIEKSVLGYNCSTYACRTCNGTVMATISNHGIFSMTNQSAERSSCGSVGFQISRWAEHRKFLYRVDDGICVALFGIPSDCVFLLTNVLRKEALQYRLKFNSKISGSSLSSAVSDFFYEQAILQSSGVRPLAVYAVIATSDSLHSIDCTGEIQCYGDIYASSVAFPLLARGDGGGGGGGGGDNPRDSNDGADDEVIALLAGLKRDNIALTTADVVHNLQSFFKKRHFHHEIAALGLNNSTFFQ